MPRKYRLGTEEIKELSESKSFKIAHTPHFSLKFQERPEGGSKFAVVVPKKATKSAVARNKIKRRGRDVIREMIPDLPSPINAVLYAKKGADTITFKETKTEIASLLT